MLMKTFSIFKSRLVFASREAIVLPATCGVISSELRGGFSHMAFVNLHFVSAPCLSLMYSTVREDGQKKRTSQTTTETYEIFRPPGR